MLNSAVLLIALHDDRVLVGLEGDLRRRSQW
jgi:hypothetical protein